MIVFFIGAGLIIVVLGLFYLKDELHSPMLARLAYSELTMRITVFAIAMLLVGALLLIGDYLSAQPIR